ncbi:MAG: chromosomal replication initiator DnaA [Sphingobium sp.]
MSQLGLPFDWAGQAHAGQFILSEANRMAAQHIEQWRDWPVPISILSGPPKSGKTTLGHHFAVISGGDVIDDAPRMANDQLFYRWNMARDSGRPLLLVSRDVPASWTVTLPDLRSRIAAAPHVRIEEPDDALVHALIENGLARAGSAYSADLPDWLARRTERSYAAIALLLDRLNAMSLASTRKISVPMAKEALQNLGFLPISGDEPASPAAHPQGEKNIDNV